MKIKTIFLDFDGTIHDIEYWHLYCLDKLRKYFGGIASKKLLEEYRKIKENLPSLSPHRKDIFEVLIQRFKSAKTSKFLQEKWEEAEEEYWDNKPRLYPKARDFLNFLKNRYKICLVTGSTEKKRKEILTKLKIRKYFDKIITTKSHNFSKSNTEIYKFALNTMNSDPKQTVMIGDEEKDMVAKKLGIRTVYINRRGKIPSITPDFVVKDLEGVINILRKNLK